MQILLERIGPIFDGAGDVLDDEHTPATMTTSLRNDEAGEPDRQPGVPVSHAQGDDSGEQERFVGDRIENGSERSLLVEIASNVAVDGVAERGESEDDQGGNAEADLLVLHARRCSPSNTRQE